MKEQHGLPDAVKIAAVSVDTQSVRVTDGNQLVLLSLGSCSFPAGLTPQQARWIANQLISSACRVEEALA